MTGATPPDFDPMGEWEDDLVDAIRGAADSAADAAWSMGMHLLRIQEVLLVGLMAWTRAQERRRAREAGDAAAGGLVERVRATRVTRTNPAAAVVSAEQDAQPRTEARADRLARVRGEVVSVDVTYPLGIPRAAVRGQKGP